MSEEQKEAIDETSGFVSVSDDSNIEQPEADETQESEESANSEEEGEGVKDSDSNDEDKSEDVDDLDSGVNAPASEEKTNKSNGVQKRISKVVKEREEARRKAEKLQKEIDDLRASKSQKEESVKEPIESDFSSHEDYLDALDSYEEKIEKSKPESTKQKNDNSENNDDLSNSLSDSQKTALGVINDVVDNADDLPSDFKEVALNDELPITGEMLEALAECDDPIKVMYHLGKNKDLAEQIAKGTPVQQMREISKLDLTAEKVKPPKPKTTTKAPDPIDPVKGSNFHKKSKDEMSFNEYEEERLAEINKRNSGGW